MYLTLQQPLFFLKLVAAFLTSTGTGGRLAPFLVRDMLPGGVEASKRS